VAEAEKGGVEKKSLEEEESSEQNTTRGLASRVSRECTSEKVVDWVL
jgi:hypothetical protein